MTEYVTVIIVLLVSLYIAIPIIKKQDEKKFRFIVAELNYLQNAVVKYDAFGDWSTENFTIEFFYDKSAAALVYKLNEYEVLCLGNNIKKFDKKYSKYNICHAAAYNISYNSITIYYYNLRNSFRKIEIFNPFQDLVLLITEQLPKGYQSMDTWGRPCLKFE